MGRGPKGAVVAGSPEDRFDPRRGLWTLAGCAATALLWAAICAACGYLARG